MQSACRKIKGVRFQAFSHGRSSNLRCNDKLSVYKLKNNKKLTETDLRELERILWTELGSKEDYIKEYGETPIGRLVRKIVGVDRAAVTKPSVVLCQKSA